ncbi:MAG: hypothetical protein KKF16_07310 [Euryarchaeota archaeon]|nr:hypothetical protein [Euryarchaeota archaeon]MBV1729977.1 hypothetical protein [Methanobacterium sp.]
MLLNDFKGQLAIEYIFWLGLSFIVILSMVNMAMDSDELNMAITAARSGAIEGANMNSFAVFPEKSFSEYENHKERINFPSSIRILKIDAINCGFNNSYQKTKIQLIAHVSAPGIIQKTYKDSLGSRINYYMRRSISKVFRTENITNSFHNPAFSPKYVFTTADVRWV